MRILISNDDGVTAPGLAALYAALADYTECVVIAPEQDKSGASSSLTLDRPLHPQYLANGFISLNGTPTDCVHLGLNGLLEREPDMVVSGINLGANLGDDVLYSGTVAAALEGRFLERPSFAFSLCSRQVDNLATAAHFARKLVEAHAAAIRARSGGAVARCGMPRLFRCPLGRSRCDRGYHPSGMDFGLKRHSGRRHSAHTRLGRRARAEHARPGGDVECFGRRAVPRHV